MSEARDRLVLGFLAGFSATLPMTFGMSWLHRRLPPHERYPLPPREISEDLPRVGFSASAATLAYHFLYGGVTGALFGRLIHRRDGITGPAFGVAVWVASYLGWIPAARILRFGTAHPARRSGLMLISHLIWGGALAVGLRELEKARDESFSLSRSTPPRLADRTEYT